LRTLEGELTHRN